MSLAKGIIDDTCLVPDMPDKAREEEEVRLKDVLAKLDKALAQIQQDKKAFDIQ